MQPEVPLVSSALAAGWQSTGSQRRILPPLPPPASSPQTSGAHEAEDAAAGVHSAAKDVPQHGASGRSQRRSHSQPEHEMPISHRPMFLASPRGDVELQTMTTSYARAQANWETVTSDMVQRWAANGGKGRKITVNASGMVCTSYEGYLRRFPGTLLSEMVRDQSGALHKKSVIFLDRHPFATYEIVNCYRDGFLPVKPPHIPMEVWQNELLYFRMHKCTAKVSIPGLEAFLRLYQESELNVDPSAPPPDTWRYTAFQLLDVPESSASAKCFSIVSMLLVAFSVAAVCIETLQECNQNAECVQFLADSDVVIVSIFSIEYLLRFAVNARKIKFLCGFLNFVDLLSILPTWLSLIASDSPEVQVAAASLRVVRILRVFKLARHNTGLQVLAKTATEARNELGQVAFCFTIAVVLFAAIVFYTEEHVETPWGQPFQSIPHSMWWAIITLCTVGYGDMSPITPLGKVFGSMCCVAGVVMVALPISVISSTFQDMYQEHLEGQKIVEAQRLRQKQLLNKISGRPWFGGALGSIRQGSILSPFSLLKSKHGFDIAQQSSDLDVDLDTGQQSTSAMPSFSEFGSQPSTGKMVLPPSQPSSGNAALSQPAEAIVQERRKRVSAGAARPPMRVLRSRSVCGP